MFGSRLAADADNDYGPGALSRVQIIVRAARTCAWRLVPGCFPAAASGLALRPQSVNVQVCVCGLGRVGVSTGAALGACVTAAIGHCGCVRVRTQARRSADSGGLWACVTAAIGPSEICWCNRSPGSARKLRPVNTRVAQTPQHNNGRTGKLGLGKHSPAHISGRRQIS